MTTSDIIEDFENPTFNVETFGGISIVVETVSGFVNVSRMCSDNGKRWRAFKTTSAFAEIVEIYRKYIENTDQVDGVKKLTPLKNAKKGVKPEHQGEYIHPKLVHFVAEYVSKDYAFRVAELMNSIDDAVHHQLKQEDKPDTPENAKPLFLSSVETLCDIISPKPTGQATFEHQFCWGVRDLNTGANTQNAIHSAINDLIRHRKDLKELNPQLFAVVDAQRLEEISKLEKRQVKTQYHADRLKFLTDDNEH